MSSIRLLGYYLNARVWWFGVAALALGVTCLGLSLYFRNDAAIESDSSAIAAVGRVIHKGERSDWVAGKLRPVYTLRYQFVDDHGVEYQGAADVAESTWKQCRLGQSLPIRYSADDPTVNRAMFDPLAERRPVPMILAAVGAVLCAVGAIFAGLAFWRAVHRVRVVHGGDPHVARITEKLPIRSGQAMQIGYAFTDGRGVARDGQMQSLRRRLAERWNVGDPILVLTRDDDVLHHEVDIWDARAADLARLLHETQGRS